MIDEKKVYKLIDKRIKEANSMHKYYKQISKTRPLSKAEFDTSVMMNSIKYEMLQLRDHIAKLTVYYSQLKAK